MPMKTRGSDRHVEVYSDASWAPGGGRSRTGWVVFWNDAIIDYGSNKQTLTSLSSCEAELRAATDAWLRTADTIEFMRELDVVTEPVCLYCDNQATLANAVVGWRNRHFSMMAQRLNEEVNGGRLVWSWVPGETIPADGLTKVLTRAQMPTFRGQLGLQA